MALGESKSSVAEPDYEIPSKKFFADEVANTFQQMEQNPESSLRLEDGELKVEASEFIGGVAGIMQKVARLSHEEELGKN